MRFFQGVLSSLFWGFLEAGSSPKRHSEGSKVENGMSSIGSGAPIHGPGPLALELEGHSTITA